MIVLCLISWIISFVLCYQIRFIDDAELREDHKSAALAMGLLGLIFLGYSFGLVVGACTFFFVVAFLSGIFSIFVFEGFPFVTVVWLSGLLFLGVYSGFFQVWWVSWVMGIIFSAVMGVCQ